MENISRTFTIYKLTSPSNKIYIGFTSMGLKARYDKHKSNFKRWLKSNKQIPGCTKLFNAFQKYGFDVWDKEILFETQNEQEAFAKEVELIELYDAITTGYNILRGGDKGRLGLTSTDEHKQKISEARTAYYETDEGKAWKDGLKTTGNFATNNPSFPGMKSHIGHHTDESKVKMSLAKKGIPQADWVKEQKSVQMKQKWAAGMYDNRKPADRSNVVPRTGFKQPQSQKDKVAKALSNEWLLTHKDGRVVQTTNMKEFCKEHGTDQGNLVSVSKGKLKQHKGWTCINLSKTENV